MRWFGKDKDKGRRQPPLDDKPEPKERASASVAPVLSGSLSLVASPYQSEKAARLQTLNQYTLAVLPGAQKNELKKQLEKTYGVHVLKITSVRLPGKKIRQRNNWGQRSERRYFRIRIKEGEVLDINKVKN